MKATLPFIIDAFSKFNSMCFEGKLPPVRIKLTNARTFLGKVTYSGRRDFFGRVVRYENYCLRISTAFDLPENELEDVVIHEMIHYYIALNRIKDTSAHGQVFRNMMEKINSDYGRNVMVRHHGAQTFLSPVKGRNRVNLLCVSHLRDGNWGVTSCAATRVLEMNRKLPRYYSLSSMEWYSSADPFFNSYPRSIKPRIYKITRAELDEHLCGAATLELNR